MTVEKTNPSKAKRALAIALRRSQLTVKPLEHDGSPLLTLTTSVYSEGDICNPTYLAWEYRDNPSGTAAVQLAFDGTVCAGQYAVIPQRYQMKAEATTTASLSVNTVTHPNYRGRGVFMILAESVYADCQAKGWSFTLGFPNPQSHKGFLKHLGFTEAGHLPLWVLPIHLGQLAQATALRDKPLLRGILRILSPLRPQNLFSWLGSKSTLSIKTIHAIDYSFDALWAACQKRSLYQLVRDGAFFTWRYANHPTRRYVLLGAYAGDRLCGVAVWRKTDMNGIPCGMLVDLLAEPGANETQATAALLRKIIALAHEERVALVGSLMPSGSPSARLLSKAGFWRCPTALLPQPFPVILRWHLETPPPSDFFDLAQWHLTMGDYDAV